MFQYEYVKRNEGRPSPYSAIQSAIAEALTMFHGDGQWEWTEISIKQLPCEPREQHYPDICWHYRVTITPATSQVDHDALSTS